ncbi:MAG: leucyl/phenylalanyl-tRNA--protein transferase [Desulfovibrionaceae bacterium]
MSLLTADTDYFPPFECAEEGGLVAAGGDLSPQRLLAAYTRGIFPWYGPNLPLLWWSPDPRCVVWVQDFHAPRRLLRRRRRGDFFFTVNEAFTEVMRCCASVPRQGQAGTWIVPEMIEAYSLLHRMGYAHSVEAWQGTRLVAGLYGVALGRVFFGESMFTLCPDASKLALLELVDRLRAMHVCLLDCQQYTAHMARFGAVEIPRKDFVAQLAHLL